ncbi:helix-turn-helix domain-containing protein [Kribbella sp. NPDC000426]|uniref:helix-turn-helix transcriptional regulator n=1 Tax=Kribbella sp. NPDC000426 TaxID=3154255 RepID=UPI00331C1225
MATLDVDPLWDIDQVAAYLGVPKRTLYRWRTLGYGPPAKKVGRHLRYRASDVITWFADLPDHILDERCNG